MKRTVFVVDIVLRFRHLVRMSGGMHLGYLTTDLL